MTMFLGLAEGEDGHARPMTAQFDDDLWDGDTYRGPIWFFTSTDSELYQKLGNGGRAMAHFNSKGPGIWATVHGTLSQSHDHATVDKLWNRLAAAWYPGGKDDPKLALIRLDAESAEIWIDASSIVAGLKRLLGIDPKQDYQNKVAEVTL